MDQSVPILEVSRVTHNVLQFKTGKPEDYEYSPGQATEVAIDKDEWRDELRPFTFTNLPDEDHLEFVIKIYPSHEGVTEQLANLKPGDSFLLDDAWGAIQYKGPGVFIAGGAGITPFIAIFRDLASKDELAGNTLLFANKARRDIIFKDQFEQWLGSNFVNVLSEEEADGYHHGYIDKEFLGDQLDDLNQYFYICGPQEMIEDVVDALDDLGVDEDHIVTEDLE